MQIFAAPDIHRQIKNIVKHLELPHLDPKRIICFRSEFSTSRARARIWSLPRIWQMALNVPAHYVVEVLSQHFDHLNNDDKIRVLIHELMHIPKNFSGALLPHRGRGKGINHHTVETLFKQFKNNK